MAYNSNTGIVYIDTSTTPNVGVSIYDIQQALGRGDSDIGLLCSDRKWAGTSLVRAEKINPLAKYKPVRHSALAVLSQAQRASTRYGFGAGLPPTLDLTQNNLPQNDWVYKPPRGKGGGDNGEDEWYRFRDFEGYASGACTPLVVSTGQLVYDSGAESQLILFGNDKSNAIREDGKRWEPDQSLSLEELLESASDLYGYYISFLLIDKTDYAKNLLVTNKTMSDFVNSEYSAFIFPVYAQGQTVSGVTYPPVPILDSSRRGHTFSVIVCLLPGLFPPSGYGYSVYTSATTPAVSTLAPYSLGFASGCDRTEEQLTSGAFKMDGTAVTSVNVSCIDMATEMTGPGGYTYRAYKIVVRAVYDTTQASGYSGREMVVSGPLVITTTEGGNSFPIGTTPNNGVDTINTSAVASLVSQQAGQDKLAYSSSDEFLWVMKNQGALIQTTLKAYVSIDYPMDNPTTPVAGTATIS